MCAGQLGMVFIEISGCCSFVTFPISIMFSRIAVSTPILGIVAVLTVSWLVYRPIIVSGRRLNTSLFALPFAYLGYAIKRTNTGRLAL
jgi:hypothetical protein